MEISEIKKQMPNEETIASLAELYKVFGDKTRASILSALSVQPMVVQQLAECLGMTVSAVSHQLKILRDAKLVKGTKQGKEVLYALDDEHVTCIIQCALDHINEED